MPRRFPSFRSDGSFCIKLIFDVKTENPNETSTQIQTWLNAWVINNQIWNWQERVLRFCDDFRRTPFGVECSTDLLSFSLEGQPNSEWWKDWIGFRLLKDLQAAFIEIGALREIVNCEGP